MTQSNAARAVSPTVAAPLSAPSPVDLRATPLVVPAQRVQRVRAGAPVWPVVLFCSALIGISIAGWPYYAAERAQRVRHEWHAWLRPSGYVGQTAGIVAFVIFVFLWLYPLRKTLKSLSWTGSVGKWLDIHVASAIGLPLLLAIHAAWRSEGLIGLGADAMLVVCASGIVGRYLYTRIPRTRTGVELTRDEVGKQRDELLEQIARATQLPVADIEKSLVLAMPASRSKGLWSAFWRLLLGDWHRWKLARSLPQRWAEMSPRGHRVSKDAVHEAVKLARREMALVQQSQMLDATHRIFRFWHVAHKPFAISALIAVVVHVVVVVAVGQTWFY